MLMRYLEEQIVANIPGNQTILHLHVETYNKAAISLYQNEGFEINRTCSSASSKKSLFGNSNRLNKVYYYMQKEADDSGNVTESDFIGPLNRMRKTFKDKYKKLEYKRLMTKVETNFEIFEEEEEAEKNAMYRKTYLDVLNDV
jgi:hypothetical protein